MARWPPPLNTPLMKVIEERERTWRLENVGEETEPESEPENTQNRIRKPRKRLVEEFEPQQAEGTQKTKAKKAKKVGKSCSSRNVLK